jgi:hypothetical protein
VVGALFGGLDIEVRSHLGPDQPLSVAVIVLATMEDVGIAARLYVDSGAAR